MGEHNTHNIITSNDIRRVVAISNIIISKDISFNLAQKTWFKRVVDLEINVSKGYHISNRNMISKYLLDVIHDHNMERNLILIKK